VTGITGQCTITGIPSFGMQVLFWKESTTISDLDITGQGDADQSDSIGLIENGNAILRGKVQRENIPFPKLLKDAIATFTFYLDKPASATGQAPLQMTATFRIDKVENELDEKTKTFWDMTIVAVRQGGLTASGFANNATTSALTPRPAGNKYLYRDRSKVYDPNSLQSTSDQTFAVWGITTDNDAAEVTAIGAILAAYSTAPQTNQKQVVATGRRLSSGVMMIAVHWGYKDTVDLATYPQMVSTRSALDPFTDRNSVVITSGITVANLANTLWGQFQGVPYSKSLSVMPLTPNQKLVNYDYHNIGYLVRGSTRSGARGIKAQMSGSTPQLWVNQFFQYSGTLGGSYTGRAMIVLDYLNDYSISIRDFIIYRIILGTTIPENSSSSINGVTLPDIGQLNYETFLGLPAKTAVYQGVKFKLNLGLTAAGNMNMLVGYSFHANSNGIINGVPNNIFNRRLIQQISALTYTGPGWYSAAALGFPGVVQPTVAAAGAFGAFVSLP
jgi:hypothetical protein